VCVEFVVEDCFVMWEKMGAILLYRRKEAGDKARARGN
jgi:hypothetical protein